MFRSITCNDRSAKDALKQENKENVIQDSKLLINPNLYILGKGNFRTPSTIYP